MENRWKNETTIYLRSYQTSPSLKIQTAKHVCAPAVFDLRPEAMQPKLQRIQILELHYSRRPDAFNKRKSKDRDEASSIANE
jgi:hypothetical protein